MKESKFILDATAGFRMMWYNKKHPNCIYLDQRPECEPDIVGDFRDLNQFKDETFKLIVFDPPHIIRMGASNANMQREFGKLEPETWQGDLKKAFNELWRVLAPYGILIFKWSNRYIPSDKVIKLAPEKPLFYQVSANKKIGSSGKRIRRVHTLWFCFMKIPKKERKP